MARIHGRRTYPSGCAPIGAIVDTLAFALAGGTDFFVKLSYLFQF